jgi:hypothetical protein
VSLFNRFFKKDKIDKFSHPMDESKAGNLLAGDNEVWEELPVFINADSKDYQRVSLVATAIATGAQTDSQYVIKRILKRNTEAKQVSLIAASVVAGDFPESQLSIRKILKKKK